MSPPRKALRCEPQNDEEEVTMPLDPIIAPLLVDYSDGPGVIEDYDEFREEVRRNVEAGLPQLAEPGPWVRSIEDHRIAVRDGSIVLRVFRPLADGPRPIHLYFHGGGWVLGSAYDAMTEITCRERAAMAGHVVVAVDYRKAPEHKFPTALDDAYAALLWIAGHREEIGGLPDVITVGGGSAGGNIAAALALKVRDEGGPPIALQLLEVPVLDLTFSQPSYDLYGSGYALSSVAMEGARRDYLDSPSDRTDPYASPLLAQDLSGLPPAFIISAEFDVVRDDGAAYAERLRQAGVPARFALQLGQVHSSSLFTKISPAARAWRDQLIAALRGVPGNPAFESWESS
jgi:acetyl esterase